MSKSPAELYIEKARELMPHHASELTDGIDASTSLDHIDDIVFHRSEYIGGMAAVIIAIVKSEI